MKKWLMKLFIVLGILTSCISTIEVNAEEVDITPHSHAAVLIDYETGTLIYAKNENEKLYPASMTKMMTLILVMEHLHAGVIDWKDEITVSEYAESMGGAQVYLEQGEVISIEELVKSTAIASANDAAVVLAEKVGGTVNNFVAMMNKKAQELGCTNTNFMNPTGLHDDQHYSSAMDMALIAQELIRVGGDDVLQYTSSYEGYIREDTDSKFWLVNTNSLVRTYEGMDGLKTGFTNHSRYCITVSAIRDGMRLIGVVMNVATKDERSADATALLDYGFATYHLVQDIAKNTDVMEITIDKGKPSQVMLRTIDDVSHLSRVDEEIMPVRQETHIQQNHAPIEAGQEIGKLIIEYNDGSTSEVGLTIDQSVYQLDFIDLFFKALKNALFC